MEEKIALVLQVQGGAEAVREINRLDDGVKDLGDQIKSLRADSRQTQKELDNTTKKLSELAKEGKRGSQEYQELTKRSEELNKVLSSNSKRVDDLRVSQRSLREERKAANGELNKQIRDLRKFGKALPNDSLEVMARNTARLKNELKTFPKEIVQLNRAFENNSKALRGVDSDTIKLLGQYRKLKKEYTDNRRELDKFDSDIGGFSSRINSLTDAFKNLNLGGFIGKQGGSSSIAQSLDRTIGGLDLDNLIGKGGRAGAIGAAITGAVALGVEIRNNTLLYEELFGKITRKTDLRGTELQEFAALLRATDKTLEDVEFDDLLSSLNSVNKAFGGDLQENAETVNKGLFALGSSRERDQYLDDIREYSVLMDKAGLSTEEFVNLSVIQNRDGFFNDKLIDATKEALLSLEEFTATQKRAISDVLGQDFADDLERRIRDGVITSKQAILEIGAALEQNETDIQGVARITADVTKGAGEDIGGFQKLYQSLLEATTTDIEDLTEKTDAYTQRQLALQEANIELEKQNAILASQFEGLGIGFDTLTVKAETFAKSILNETTFALRGLSKVFQEEGLLQGLLNFNQVGFARAAQSVRNQESGVQATNGRSLGRSARPSSQIDLDENGNIQTTGNEPATTPTTNTTSPSDKAAQENKRLEEEAEKARKLAEKVAKLNEDFAKEKAKLEGEIGDLTAKNNEQTLADISEFNRQLNELNAEREAEKASIDSELLSPELRDQLLENDPEALNEILESISDQTDLVDEKYDQFIQQLIAKRKELLDAQSKENFQKALQESEAVDASQSREVLETFNDALSDLSDEENQAEANRQRIQLEKDLQRELLEIQLAGLQQRREIILASTELTGAEREQLLLQLAEREKAIASQLNLEVTEIQKKAANEQAALQKKVADSTEKAVKGIGEALGNFIVDSTKDSEEAFKAFAKSTATIILDLIGQQLTLLVTRIFSTTASVSTGGAAGLVQLALVQGLIQGGISALKSQIGSFEGGGRIKPERLTDLGIFKNGGSVAFPAKGGGIIQGPSHDGGGVKFFMRQNGKNFIGEAEGGEMILNKQQQQKGAQLFGPDYLSRIGVPDSHNIFSNVDRMPIPQLGWKFYQEMQGNIAQPYNSEKKIDEKLEKHKDEVKDAMSEELGAIKKEFAKALVEIGKKNESLIMKILNKDKGER